jgi:hypothetical protein
MHGQRRSLLFVTLAAAMLLAVATPSSAQRRGNRRAARRDIPNSTLALTVPSFGFKRRAGEPALLFNRRFENIEDGVSAHEADVFAFVGGRWIEPRLRGSLSQSDWTFVGRVPNRAEFWAVAEIDVAGPGDSLEILSTRDGATWSHYSLNKVSRFADFVSFHMNARGVGSVVLQLTEDSPGVEPPSRRPGYYTYTTTNGGRTWSRRPRFTTARPPEPGRPLERPDADYDDSTPPGAPRLREILRELSR